ncbi:helix-turn-helix domain-containing protein [Goodfellowiella coeruleoviolacea]|uniref:Helix-turn-helix domain-containing protein n=1 Tax=Goodfellowiella coeruleoviolacea TaxID=334858 RepID=A0AAE3GH50_9PSEU|nr:helix-turn-helix transcriptional regulator [Goodfellowiella coeruleoviolacea]MCP2168152.1 Helix-turn-helix domain-containing protein [Goodfellowiella coeruleoviolacea]
MPSTQTRRKRKLGKFLVELRERAGLKPEAVAGLLRKSTSTISRMENGHTLCDYAVLTAMLGFYQATAEQRKQAEDLWEEAKQETAPVQHSSSMPPKYRAFLKAWDDASSARTLQQSLFPGPLQTPAYRAAMYRALARFINSGTDADRDSVAIERRQQRLHGPNPMEFLILLDEAVIRRPIGGPLVMAEQLRHVVRLTQLPNVSVRLIPFAAGEYGAMTGGLTVLAFPAPDESDVVYLEYPSGGDWIEKADDVAKFAGTFDDALSLALSESDSIEVMTEQARRLEQEQ